MPDRFNPGFRFTDASEWKSYFQSTLPPLVETSRDVLSIAGALRQGARWQLGQVPPAVRRLLLGGFHDGRFDSQAIGSFVRAFYGVGVDPALVARHLATAKTMGEAGLNRISVALDSREPQLLTIAKGAFQQGSAILGSLPKEIRPASPSNTRTPSDTMQLLERNPLLAVDAVTRFLNSLLTLLPTRNPRSLFISSLAHVPRAYLGLLYPSLYADGEVDTGSWVSGFLGFTRLFEASRFGLPAAAGVVDGLAEPGVGLALNRLYSLVGEGADAPVRRWYGETLATQGNDLGQRIFETFEWDPLQMLVIDRMRKRSGSLLLPQTVAQLCDDSGSGGLVYSVVAPLCFARLLDWEDDKEGFRFHPFLSQHRLGARSVTPGALPEYSSDATRVTFPMPAPLTKLAQPGPALVSPALGFRIEVGETPPAVPRASERKRSEPEGWTFDLRTKGGPPH